MQCSFNALIRKLEHIHPLTSEEMDALKKSCVRTVRFSANRDLVRQGEQPEDCHILLDGFVYRYTVFEDGRRQILSFHVPGDIYDTLHFLLPEADHNIATLTPGTVALVSHQAIIELTEQFPRIARALWKETLIEAAMFREWIASLGRRSAYGRIAHLICEMYVRVNAVGLARNFTIEWPITQSVMGDSQGLSTVHVNRTVQELRAAGLIQTQQKKLVITDWKGLQSAAEFDPAYLRLRLDSITAGEHKTNGSRPSVNARNGLAMGHMQGQRCSDQDRTTLFPD
jgi:CRP-like cAMP-binding protein